MKTPEGADIYEKLTPPNTRRIVKPQEKARIVLCIEGRWVVVGTVRQEQGAWVFDDPQSGTQVSLYENQVHIVNDGVSPCQGVQQIKYTRSDVSIQHLTVRIDDPVERTEGPGLPAAEETPGVEVKDLGSATGTWICIVSQEEEFSRLGLEALASRVQEVVDPADGDFSYLHSIQLKL